MSTERDLWSVYEPVHAIVYFDPAVSGCLAEEGLHGFWNGYFAGRFAPLGPVGPGPVTALAYGFAPAMVDRALPKVWGRISPAQAVLSRLGAVSRTLTPLLEAGSTDDVRRVTEALVRATDAARYDGRALAAAWKDVPEPDDLAARLWWATTVLREQRGDSHVIAATAAGLSGLEAGITHCALGPLTRESLQPNRGWTDEDWDGGVARLADRGLLTVDGTALTAAGRGLREQLEDATDRLAAAPAAAVSDDLPLITSVLTALAKAIAEAGSLPYLNPMGVPIPE